MKFTPTNITKTIADFRTKLYQELTAPVDAMWELLYINSSQHYLIESDDQLIGYCCINEEDSLLQIFLVEAYMNNMQNVIAALIEEGLISSAKLSSSAAVAFNACLFHSKSIKANTLCFQHSNKPMATTSSLKLQLALEENIPAIKAFLKEQVGMDDTFGYTENLVTRKEIFFITESDEIIATSECRLSDTQPEVADLGIIVNKHYQGQGIATQVMQMQVTRVFNANRRPICSTTIDNIASRIAIERSGFYCSNIIFNISFLEN